MISREDLYTAIMLLVPDAGFVFWPDDGSGDTKGYDNLQNIDGWLISWYPSNTQPMPTLSAIQALPAYQLAAIEFEESGLPKLSIYIDSVAQQKQYDNAISCVSYATSTNSSWQAQALAFIAWRDSVYNYAIAQFALMQSNSRTVPTFDEFKTEFPLITWPS